MSALIAASFSVSAAAWNESPGEFEEDAPAVTSTATETSASEEVPPAEDEVAEDEDPGAPPAEDIVTEPELSLDGEETPESEDEEEEPSVIEDADETENTEEEPPVIVDSTETVTSTEAAPPPPASYTATDPFTMYVDTTINVRSGPGTDYDKLGVFYPGAEVKVLGTSADWYAVDYYGSTGYVLSSLLVSEPPATSATTTTTAAPVEAETEEAPQPEEEAPSEEENEDEGAVLEPEAEITTTTQAPAPVVTETSEEEENEGAGVTDNNEKSDGSGIPPVLLALICAVATFVIIGVVPVLIHKAHHKKLYQY